MPAPFKRINLDEFEALLGPSGFTFTRRINAVHMHHTWKPSRSQFKGHDTIVAMWQYHTATNGWRDIAQHITIDPEGSIWLGRNWNWAPASASGHNGNDEAGPFMFEMVGNFDTGFDPFDGEQREAAVGVIARLQRRFNLPEGSLVFHRAMGPKTCPGSGIDYRQILGEVREAQAALGADGRTPGARGVQSPFPAEALEIRQTIAECVKLLTRETAGGREAGDAEPTHEEFAGREEAKIGPAPPRGQRRGTDLDAAELAALRPHVINLRMGQFSSDGLFSTTPADVDAIFDQHAPAFFQTLPGNESPRLVFFAHGGLVSESDGLRIAAKQVAWWKANRVYPIHFVWETGFFETIGQLLSKSRQQTARALARDIWDHTTDPLIETAVRALQGVRIWGGMKASAQAASAPGGGARYAAGKLKELCDRLGGRIDLHAVGHSAGAIFHSHFLPAALDLGVPTFASLSFLAPAIRVDEFKARLFARIGHGIGHLGVFTMLKDFEEDDNCASIYHKSLLYLIYHALEPERKTDILGLEISLRGDPEVRTLLGQGAAASAVGDVVWSVTPTTDSRSSSTSTSHGGFDDDPPTMNSVLRRIRDLQDADAIVGFPAPDVSRALRRWEDQVDWPPGMREAAPAPPAASYLAVSPMAGAVPPPPPGASAAGSARKRALCVGIDRYPSPYDLSGCVADARLWGSALTRLGFEPPVLLLNEDAQRSAILERLDALIAASAPGDVLVFQYAGHGAQVPDLDGDEDDGTDETICPVDFDRGEFLLDDDIAAAIARVRDGVNLTCFMDCCHSGTNTRFLGPGGLPRPAGRGVKARYLIPTPAHIQAHRAFRARLGVARSAPRGTPSQMRAVNFAACQPDEKAWESNGQGVFTLRATSALQTGVDGLSNQSFLDRVTQAFGADPPQHPNVDCTRADALAAFLGPRAGATPAAPTARPMPPGLDVKPLLEAIQALLRQLPPA